MNFFGARVVEDNGRLYVDGGSFRLAIPRGLEAKYRIRLNDEVVFGIRPENINEYAFAGEIEGKEKLAGQVDVIEPVGSEIILIVTLGGHHLTAKVHRHTRASLHERIELAVDMNEMHLFDKQTGEIV
jgi:multiple sugar transport system ATP-binding protein